MARIGLFDVLLRSGESFGFQQRVISTTNRNFESRQGPETRTHLASPVTVAASAIAGHIVDPREYLERPLRRDKEAGVPVGAIAGGGPGSEQEDYLWGV